MCVRACALERVRAMGVCENKFGPLIWNSDGSSAATNSSRRGRSRIWDQALCFQLGLWCFQRGYKGIFALLTNTKFAVASLYFTIAVFLIDGNLIKLKLTKNEGSSPYRAMQPRNTKQRNQKKKLNNY